MKLARLALVGGAFIAGILWAQACQGQAPVARDTVFGFPTDALGLTFCDAHGEARSWADLGLDDTTAAMVRAHEMVHLAQIRRYDQGCRAFEDRIMHDHLFAADAEAEAWAETVRIGERYGKNPSDMRMDFMMRVYRQFAGEVSYPAIAALFTKYLGPMTP